MKNFVTLHVIDVITSVNSIDDIETGDKKCVKIRPEMIVAFWPKKSREIRSIVMVVFPNNECRYWTVEDSVFELEKAIEGAENGKN